MAEVVRRKADFSELRLFWAVTEAGSFGAAARALGVSTSTLTRAVDNLESRLGTKLLVRSPHGVSPTPAGIVAFNRVQVMERAAASLELEIADHDKAATGVVKISAPDGIGGFWVAPYIPEFLRANPDIDLVMDCALWLDRPVDGEVDVALTFTRPEQEELIAQPLAYLHYVLIAARSHIDLYGKPATRQETLAHPYVHHIAQVHQRDEKAAAYQLTARHRLTTNSSAVSFNAVREGAGIHPLPTAALALDPSLVVVDDMHHGPITMWLVQRREMMRSARVRKVVAWLEEVFDQATQPWYREEYVPPSEFQEELKRYVAKRRGLSVQPPTPLRERA